MPQVAFLFPGQGAQAVGMGRQLCETLPAARKLFDDTFANFESCKVDILELDATVNGDMGIVCTVQSTNIVLKSGATKHVMARQTDCFERRGNGWELIHQHADRYAGAAALAGGAVGDGLAAAEPALGQDIVELCGALADQLARDEVKRPGVRRGWS